MPVIRLTLERHTGGLCFESIEESIEVFAIKDHAGSLSQRHKERSPSRIERATFDACVGDGFRVGQAALHDEPLQRGPLESGPVGPRDLSNGGM
ncbi:hypothetical protein GCM10007918_00730 [Piscinibacter gummiphilus]|nr:hypothetical protein GCM10007918_00730 [Piscinibacter gummiphilus]